MPEHKTQRPARHHRPARDVSDDYDARAADEAVDQDRDEDDGEYNSDAVGAAARDAPDVFLDVPALKVEEIHLEVDDLNAQVSLHANVLDLLKLHVGAEVSLGSVLLDIKGVDAVAQLKVRLDKVAMIIDRVMTTIDDNPQILTELTRRLGEAATEIGEGAAGGLKEVGKGTGRAAEEVGEGARSGIESVGDGLQETAGDLGEGVGRTVESVTEDGGDITDEGSRRRRSDDRDREARRTDRGVKGKRADG